MAAEEGLGFRGERDVLLMVENPADSVLFVWRQSGEVLISCACSQWSGLRFELPMGYGHG
jgi:hypothetical protein